MENVNNFESQDVADPQEEIYSYDDGREAVKKADYIVFTMAEKLYDPHKVEQRLVDTGEVLHPSTR